MKDNQEENQQINMDQNMRQQTDIDQQAQPYEEKKQLGTMILMTICINTIFLAFYFEQLIYRDNRNLLFAIIGTVLLILLDVFKLFCSKLCVLVLFHLACCCLIIIGFYSSQLEKQLRTPIWICQIVQVLTFYLISQNKQIVVEIDTNHNLNTNNQDIVAGQIPINPPDGNRVIQNRRFTFQQVAHQILNQVRAIQTEINTLKQKKFGEPINQNERTKYQKMMSYQVLPLQVNLEQISQEESFFQLIQDIVTKSKLQKHSQQIQTLKYELSEKYSQLNTLHSEISLHQINQDDLQSTLTKLKEKSEQQNNLINSLQEINKLLLKEIEEYKKTIGKLQQPQSLQDLNDTTNQFQALLKNKIDQIEELKQNIECRQQEIKEMDDVIKILQKTIKEKDEENQYLGEQIREMAISLQVQIQNDEDPIDILILTKLERILTKKDNSDIQNLITLIKKSQEEKYELQFKLKRIQTLNLQ